jgi:uncharacterized protein
VKIGVISDTHNYLDPKVLEHFRGVEHILHGGDIGRQDLLAELETIAPVTAVAGNTDDDPSYRQTAVVTLAGRKFLVHHIVTPGGAREAIAQRIEKEAPDAVIFGHTHKQYAQRHGNTLFFNPGYAGKPRFAMQRSIALIHCDSAGIKYEFIGLD